MIEYDYPLFRPPAEAQELKEALEDFRAIYLL